MPMPTITPEVPAPAPLGARPWNTNPLGKIPPLTPIATEDYFPGALKKDIEAANAKIATFTSNRENFERQHRAAIESDVRSADFDQHLMGTASGWRVRILQDELQFREEVLPGILDAIHRATVAHSDRLFAEATAARAEVEKRLLSIGYLPPPPSGEGFKNRITPAMVESHPLVTAAREAAEGCRMTAAERPGFSENEAAVELLEKTLERVREKALAMS